jgi:hypothetical protein
LARLSGGKHQNHAVDIVADYTSTNMLEDYFTGEPAEPDHNYPKPPVLATHVGLDDEDSLYIYVPQNGMPPNKFRQYTARIADDFRKALPDRTIIVGGEDLKFTTIGRKQMFKSKLDGTLSEDET